MADDGERIIEVFKKFDTNSDGVISKEELTTLLTALGPDMFTGESLETLLAAMDSNNDGKVQYAEFVHWLTTEEAEVSQVWEVAMPGKDLPKGPLARLDAIIGMSPHLSGNLTYMEARKALEKGEEDSAYLLSDKLLLQLESDASRIDAAFMRFDYSGTGFLDRSEVAAMFQYLGFPDPSEDDEVKTLIKKLDSNGTGNVEKEEFKHFVEEFGGLDALFARRRERALRDRTSSASASSTSLSTLSREEIQVHMLAAGIEPEAQAYWARALALSSLVSSWRLMALNASADCADCQKQAVSNIRRIAKAGVRAYDGCKDFERPKYGVLNVHNDYRGVVRAKQYGLWGDCYMVLRDARLRTTFSPEDSANLKAERLACLDYYAHVLHEYTDDELRETLKVATTGKLGSSDAILAKGLKYKEAQYHGEVAFARHVERLVLPKVDKYTGREADIKKVCEKNGWEWCWMEEEKARREAMEAEDASDEKMIAWKAKLKAMAERPSEDVKVPEGFCVKGCGKPVADGLTKNGNPYKTCCRGCALGFGHDLRCGLKDGERPPCKMGCGMLAAPGKTSRGRPLDTCCRGCAKGGEHDVRCTKEIVPCRLWYGRDSFAPLRPDSVYKDLCPAGFYCAEATTYVNRYKFRCPVGFYCPEGTGARDDLKRALLQGVVCVNKRDFYLAQKVSQFCLRQIMRNRFEFVALEQLRLARANLPLIDKKEMVEIQSSWIEDFDLQYCQEDAVMAVWEKYYSDDVKGNDVRAGILAMISAIQSVDFLKAGLLYKLLLSPETYRNKCSEHSQLLGGTPFPARECFGDANCNNVSQLECLCTAKSAALMLNCFDGDYPAASCVSDAGMEDSMCLDPSTDIKSGGSIDDFDLMAGHYLSYVQSSLKEEMQARYAETQATVTRCPFGTMTISDGSMQLGDCVKRKSVTYVQEQLDMIVQRFNPVDTFLSPKKWVTAAGDPAVNEGEFRPVYFAAAGSVSLITFDVRHLPDETRYGKHFRIKFLVAKELDPLYTDPIECDSLVAKRRRHSSGTSTSCWRRAGAAQRFPCRRHLCRRACSMPRVEDNSPAGSSPLCCIPSWTSSGEWRCRSWMASSSRMPSCCSAPPWWSTRSQPELKWALLSPSPSSSPASLRWSCRRTCR
ncbi:unnamed protein product [Effrenium voratum]|nr:unnamed protein product [Effrenium voratum]